MNDVHIDRVGQLRCWNCGADSFSERRTGMFWAAVILGGILTIGLVALLVALTVKPKLQCRVCGEWNRPGNAQPHTDRQVGTPHLGQLPPSTRTSRGDHLPRRKSSPGN